MAIGGGGRDLGAGACGSIRDISNKLKLRRGREMDGLSETLAERGWIELKVW